MSDLRRTPLTERQSFKFESRRYSSDELVQIGNDAVRNGDRVGASAAWTRLASDAPAALCRFVPERARAPLKALDSLIRDVRTRISLEPNATTDKPFECLSMRTSGPRGTPEELMFLDVAHVYANREGFSARVSLRAYFPFDPIAYRLDYFEGTNCVNGPDELANVTGNEIALPSIQFIGGIEHLFSRVSAGRHLEPDGTIYRRAIGQA